MRSRRSWRAPPPSSRIEGFLAKAADDVVASEREKQTKLTQQLDEIVAQLAELDG